MKLKVPELRRARIEIVPMIDTIFFLLVFFMITWLSMVKMSGLALTLPRENTSSGKPPAAIVLSVSGQGNYYLDSKAVGQTAWRRRLLTDLLAHPNGVVVVNVDPLEKTQTLIAVIDSVNRTISASHSQAQVLVATQRVRLNGGVESNSHSSGGI